MRLAEVQAMTPEKWQSLRQDMRQAQNLPNPNDFEGYLQGGRGWWVRVEEFAGRLKVQRW